MLDQIEYNDSILEIYSFLYTGLSRDQILSTPGSIEESRLKMGRVTARSIQWLCYWGCDPTSSVSFKFDAGIDSVQPRCRLGFFSHQYLYV